MKTPDYWIEKLELQKHPEGGWYREVYRSADVVPVTGLPVGFPGERSFSTSIYYLLEGNDFSAFHRIKSDEIWHYYRGNSAVEIILLENCRLKSLFLGTDPENGHELQLVVPKNTWFAARLVNTNGFALAGCTVSPGFHFDDFEIAGTDVLNDCPDSKEAIRSYIKTV